MHRVAAVFIVATLTLVVVGCGDASKPSTLSSSSAPTTTTTTTVPTTTAPPPPSEPQSSPQAAATELMNAWRNGDRDAALSVALPSAVDELFAAGEPGSTQNRGCQSEVQPNPQCVYRTSLGELQIRTASQGDGWIVDRATISPA
jgi:hypothetical protein